MNLTTFAKITGDNSDNSVISPPSLFLQLSKTSQKRPEKNLNLTPTLSGLEIAPGGQYLCEKKEKFLRSS